LKYLFDNNISPKLAKMLVALDKEVFAVRNVLAADAKDEDILVFLAQHPYVWISADRKQTTRPSQARLLKQAKVTALYLGPFWSKMNGWDQAVWMMRRWELIEGFVNGAAKGTIAEIKQNGKSQSRDH
jgi:predicted nuclease of predicted toxin-antitoxin system